MGNIVGDPKSLAMNAAKPDFTGGLQLFTGQDFMGDLLKKTTGTQGVDSIDQINNQLPPLDGLEEPDQSKLSWGLSSLLKR